LDFSAFSGFVFNCFKLDKMPDVPESAKLGLTGRSPDSLNKVLAAGNNRVLVITLDLFLCGDGWPWNLLEFPNDFGTPKG
jgi:hypothetical protein